MSTDIKEVEKMMEELRNDDVSYALSTWRSANQFREGIEALAKRHPLFYARDYLPGFGRQPDIEEDYYTEVDRLQALRKKSIRDEMVAGSFQVQKALWERPEALREAALANGLDPDDFPGAKVLSGDDLRAGFSAAVYDLVPSLQVYTLFLWYGRDDIADLAEKLLGEL